MWEAFGWYGLLFSCLLSFSLGFLMVVWYVATQQAKRLLEAVPLQPVREKCELLHQETTPSAQKGMGSGSPRVDEELDKVVDLCLRDYLQSWYHPLITGSTALLDEAKATSSLVVSTVSRRCQEPEFLPLFMEALVDILIGHFKLYKGALSQVTAEKSIEKCIKECDSEGWSVICAGGEAELAYLRGVTEYALNLILPLEDFSNPLFRSLAQDLIAEQILLPTAHYCTTSYYVNSAVVSLTKDTSLTGESLLIALSRASTEEIALTLSLTAEEIKVLKKRGKTELDQLQLNSLTDLSNHLSQIQETGLREADEVKYKDHIPSLKVSIPEYRLVTEGRVKHVDYKIIVQCQHKQGPVEEWNTWRSFSDLHDLHLKLKESTQAADLPTLPSQTIAFSKLDPTFLEHRKQRMQLYLQSISSQEFLNSHLNLFEHIILFLTESSYIRHSTEIARTVDKLVQPLKRAKSDIGKVQITSPSSPALFHKSVLEEAEEEEEEEEEGVAILLTLLDEVFDVAADQWIQRQLSHLLRQLLGSMLSDKMGKRMMEALDNYASGDHIADLIGQLRTSLWPDGYRAESRQPPSPETLHLTSLLARTKLIGSVPDDLKRLLGSSTTHKGIIRLFDMFQHEKFNLQLLYRIVEALLCALFPERDLNHAFHYLRTQTLLKTNIHYKENLKTIGALEIVREISSYLCYTGFSDTSGEWTITFTDGVSVWRTGLAERYVVELKVPLSQIRDCLHSGDVQASPAINSLALTLTCPQDSIDLNLLELSAADKREEMKKLIFLLAGYVTTLRDNLNDYKLKLADAQRQRETSKQDTLLDLGGRSSGKVQTRPKKPAGHSLINPSTKRRKAAAGVVFGDEESED